MCSKMRRCSSRSIPGLMRLRAEANKGCNIAGISVIDGQEVST